MPTMTVSAKYRIYLYEVESYYKYPSTYDNYDTRISIRVRLYHLFSQEGNHSRNYKSSEEVW